MEEQIVLFETAKLAKEKRFNILTLNYYFEDGDLKENELTGTNGYYGEEYCFSFNEFLENWNDKWLTKKDGNRCFGCNKSNGYLETFSAPTQSLLQRWLREVHKIHLVVWWRDQEDMFYCELGRKIQGGLIVQSGNGAKLFKSYEEALEVGLQETLKLIK